MNIGTQHREPSGLLGLAEVEPRLVTEFVRSRRYRHADSRSDEVHSFRFLNTYRPLIYPKDSPVPISSDGRRVGFATRARAPTSRTAWDRQQFESTGCTFQARVGVRYLTEARPSRTRRRSCLVVPRRVGKTVEDRRYSHGGAPHLTPDPSGLWRYRSHVAARLVDEGEVE